MELKKKQGIYLMLASAVVLVGVLVFVFGMPGTAPGDTPTATSTEPVATTTDIFDMEPIVPEAKVSTEGWKTCRNEEYGYEFKFPPEWFVYDAITTAPCSTSNDFQIVSDQPQDAAHSLYNQESSFRILVRSAEILENKSGSSIASVDDYYQYQLSFKPGPPLISSTSTVAGTKALWMGYGIVTDQGAVSFYHDGAIYDINFTNVDVHVAQTILSTFRFITAAPSV